MLATMTLLKVTALPSRTVDTLHSGMPSTSKLSSPVEDEDMAQAYKKKAMEEEDKNIHIDRWVPSP
jgi:hypothetical protein